MFTLMNDVKSAGRVLDVLELFSDMRSVLGVSDVSRRLAIPKSSAQGLLMTLTSRGYLERRGSAYALPESLQDGRWIGATRARLVRLAQPTMDRMAKECGESVFLGVLTENLDIQYVAKAISTAELRYDASLEHRRAAYSTTIGLVFLAHMSEEGLAAYFSKVKLRPLTERTTTDEQLLRKLIQRVRRQGHAELRDTNNAGVSGVSAPVFGADGGVVAGLNLGAPTWRFAEARDQLVAIAKREAAELSARLGRGRNAA